VASATEESSEAQIGPSLIQQSHDLTKTRQLIVNKITHEVEPFALSKAA
jgi:hypothetical protein